jgi:tRNA splicing ligase
MQMMEAVRNKECIEFQTYGLREPTQINSHHQFADVCAWLISNRLHNLTKQFLFQFYSGL